MKRSGVPTARKLRGSSTDAERKFWNAVRARQINGAKFRRQWPIGRYVADFVCLETKLVVEIDGGQHNESAHDAVRTAALEEAGFKVIRFWNNDVLQNLDGLLEVLAAALTSN